MKNCNLFFTPGLFMDCNKIDRLNENLTLLDYTRETKTQKKCCCKVVRSLPASVRCTSSFSTVKSCNPFKSEKKFVGNIGKLEFLWVAVWRSSSRRPKWKKKMERKNCTRRNEIKIYDFSKSNFLGAATWSVQLREQ